MVLEKGKLKVSIYARVIVVVGIMFIEGNTGEIQLRSERTVQVH